MTVYDLVSSVTSGRFDAAFSRYYGNSDMELLRVRARWLDAAEQFSRLYPECGEIRLLSAPMMVDLGGISAETSCDTIAIVSPNDEDIVRCKIGREAAAEISTEEAEKLGIVGISGKNGGFNAYISADMQSAASELLSPSGRFAELDLSDNAPFPFSGCKLCLTTVPCGEMPENRDIPDDIAPDSLYADLPELRRKYTDGELLRAIRRIEEKKRADELLSALKIGDISGFTALFNDTSPLTSLPESDEKNELLLAFEVGRKLVGGGAVRIKTGSPCMVQALVPAYAAERYTAEMCRIFGKNSTVMLTVRAIGRCGDV